MKWLRRSILIISFSIFIPSICEAVDFSDCAYELDRLRKAARDTSDTAEEAESAHQEFESAKDELEDCLSFPDVYDLMGDGCQSARWDYQSAKDEYESAIDNLVSELDTLARRIRAIEYSCGYEIKGVRKWTTKKQGAVKKGNKVKPGSVFTTKNSNIYHKRDCSRLDATKGLVEFTTSQQARNAGGLPCNDCNL